jgi:hypothetical protein
MDKIREQIHSPNFLHHFAVGNMIIWAVMVPLSKFTGWIYSVEFLGYLSIIALFLSAFGGYVSALVNRKQAQKEDSNG